MYADSKEGRKQVNLIKNIKIHRAAITLTGFNLDILKLYPKNIKEVGVPVFVIKDLSKSLLGIYETREYIL
mgnify:CR=1 FL=1